ncbi:PaaI family thioesterase [Sphingobium sp. JS3065]|uniref:PaaI family thioesterase n=1 Tax=Sphingobium sp. JS3065 TaxID=2970925 RepID=UPI0022644746|nr:PaaI family thioesterase [Sphingobium sp. JS3065]UZW56852.1 PaaI family thioesterase [Sphingobium sp. JS3065]
MADGPWAGWLSWTDMMPGTFLASAIGTSYSRSDAAGKATVMLESLPSHANRLGALHGGFLAGFADHAYFAALAAMGRPEQAAAVTVDLAMQYCGSGKVGPTLRAEVELLRETGRLMFLRLTIFRDDGLIAASTATVRKAPEPQKQPSK